MKTKKRKILILYVYDNQHELVETTTSLLLANGVCIDAICVSSFRYVKGTKTHWPWMIYLSSFFINTLRIPKSQGFFRTILGNGVFKRTIVKYDLVDFQSFPASQFELAEQCIAIGKEYLITFWGSDILRISDEIMKRMKRYLDHSKKIRLTNQIKQKLDLFAESEGVDYRLKYCGTVDGVTNGNKDIFLLDGLTEKDIATSEALFRDGDRNKLLVTIGYNGSPKQNQDKVLYLMAQLPEEIKKRIHIVLPMTYGTPPEHLALVKGVALESGISFTVLDKFLSNQEVCVLRTITDVFVMLQDTDGFAGSVRSHVYCQNVCLIGDWLEYPMEKEGVYYLKVNWENLFEKFVDVVSHYEEHHEKSLPNKEKMLPFMTWEKYIDYTSNLYK